MTISSLLFLLFQTLIVLSWISFFILHQIHIFHVRRADRKAILRTLATHGIHDVPAFPEPARTNVCHQIIALVSTSWPHISDLRDLLKSSTWPGNDH
ncbi:hypothetical protein B0J14DRAFT_587392 [Halenospora varia]|nr:hypothetical protein B0J14DRAFT_587392 [Halenospora varia]